MPGRSVLGFARQWLADAVNQGIDLNTAERLIIETVERITSRSGTGKPLKYFENPVSEAFAWHCENVEIDAIREEGSPRSYSEETKNAYRRYCNDLREAGVPPGERLSLDEWALTIEKSNVAA
ncbi:hypothetical protein [Acetobacter musti]|nr:hypothetical protein [Acetobacter musti]